MTGKRAIGGLTYDFEPGVSKSLDFVNTGGLMGAAYRAGAGLANLMYKDGGSVDLTIVRMPDITELGVESLFKTR